MAVREELKDYRKRLKDFQATFRKEIGDISTQQDKDIGVATDILAQRLKTETGVDPLGRRPELPEQERREPREVRRDLLTREEAVRQATEELGPQYEAILGQLRENIAATRQAVPQQLAARGQALGGMRAATEAGLTREEAFQTAGLQAQRAADIQQRAGQILTAEQQAAAQEQARQDALRQQQFQNQMAIRSAELQEQGFTADEAFRQAQFEFQQTQAGQEQAFRQQQFAEQQRQFGLEFGLQQQQATQRAQQLAAQRPDLAPYIQGAQGLQGQARIDYINNLQARGLIDDASANQIKGMTGVQPVVSDIQPPTVGVPPQFREDIPGVPTVTGEQVITAPGADVGLGLDISDYQRAIGNLYTQYDEWGQPIGYDTAGIQDYISRVSAVDPVGGAQLAALYPNVGMTQDQVIAEAQRMRAEGATDEEIEAMANDNGMSFR